MNWQYPDVFKNKKEIWAAFLVWKKMDYKLGDLCSWFGDKRMPFRHWMDRNICSRNIRLSKQKTRKDKLFFVGLSRHGNGMRSVGERTWILWRMKDRNKFCHFVKDFLSLFLSFLNGEREKTRISVVTVKAHAQKKLIMEFIDASLFQILLCIHSFRLIRGPSLSPLPHFSNKQFF